MGVVVLLEAIDIEHGERRANAGDHPDGRLGR